MCEKGSTAENAPIQSRQYADGILVLKSEQVLVPKKCTRDENRLNCSRTLTELEWNQRLQNGIKKV